jgi:hypothetical protein
LHLWKKTKQHTITNNIQEIKRFVRNKKCNNKNKGLEDEAEVPESKAKQGR